MHSKAAQRIVILAAPILVSACGDGGGGGTVATTSFTSWESVPLNSIVIANGLGQESTYDYDPVTKQVSNVVPGNVTGGYSAEMQFDAGALVGLKFITPSTSLSFASNQIFNVSPEVVGATTLTSNALLANPVTLGWNYQTFGVWETGLDMDTGRFGAMTVGAPSPGVPTAASATFAGRVAGSWVDTSGKGYAVLANLTVGWSGQSLTLNTTGTGISEDWSTFTPNGALDMSGTLSVAGTNGFSGTLTTTSGLTGNSAGQFYGPNAEELGGVFFLQGAGQTYSGAYGAKIQP
ncbi:MAG TPA: transferrin-binding protein-like solute binding protein [Thiobacillaceae bacterium]|nr:transferrin-binding protein-like solute binding protein [Thiobacillaceae bacterium]